MDLAQHRKFFVIVSGLMLTTLLNKLGLDAKELFGGEQAFMVDWFVDAMIIGGVPVVFNWAQPNKEGDSIWRYWRALAVGSAVVVGVISVAVWMG